MKFSVFYGLIFGYALFDAQTLINGAIEGVHLAVSVVVPSLFPFVFLSVLGSSGLAGTKITFIRPVEKLCGMPNGSGSLLLLGLCGGYPVGAQCVASTYSQGILSKKDAERLLGFCNNAGPSFIFGMVGGMIRDVRLCWLLWLGQILSSIVVGMILPGKSRERCRLRSANRITTTAALENTIQICSKIAGWVILFRTVISIAEKWFLNRLPSFWNAAIAGALELSNGCIRLQHISMPLPRFLLCGAMLCFGGLCVHLQTKSVVGSLSMRYYWIGKSMQTLLILPIIWILWKITVAF